MNGGKTGLPGALAKPVISGIPLWDSYLEKLRQHSNSHLLTDSYVANGARQYLAMISLVDESIGRLISALSALHLLDSTWIIYSSDHGEMLGDHNLMAKMNFYDSSVRVPAIIRSPSPTSTEASNGTTSDSLTEAVDLSATILDIASVSDTFGAGRSLLPILRGETHADRTYLTSEISGKLATESNFLAITDGNYRITVERSSRQVCEVFNLADDPQELSNLTGTDLGRRIMNTLSGALANEGFHPGQEGSGA